MTDRFRPVFFRPLDEEETKRFRAAGHEAADAAGDAGMAFSIDFYHHPEYRIGALEVLLEHAREEATMVARKEVKP